MEEPVLTLDVTRLRAEPGGQAQLSATVRNPGHLVESFRMDVVGLDPTWWQVHPPELAVYPGKEESAVVVLKPPVNAHAPDDALPFGVRAVSTLDAQRALVEEGDLEIGRVLDLQASITPVTSRGRWSGRHTITYRNWGNSASHLRLTVVDKDEDLGFRLEPEQVSVPVGGSATARLRVRPRNPFLRGQAVRKPFQVIGESAGAAPPPGTPRSATARAGVPDPGRPVLDAAILHLPILSRGVLVLAGLLVAAVAGLVVASLRTSTVVGARQPDVAPDPPTGLVAQGVAADIIQLRWNPSDRAQTYSVRQVDETTGAGLSGNEVADGATAFGAKVDKPLTTACYQVIAVRGTLESAPSERRCAQSLDGRLAAPTNVTVKPAADGYTVSWTDDERNDHLVLTNRAQVGPVSPAPSTNLTVTLPAGQQCITVVARQGALSSPESAPPQCVTVTPPPSATPTAAAGPGGGGATSGAPAGTPGGAGSPTTSGGAGGAPTASAATTPGAAALGAVVAVIGPPYQQRALAESTLAVIRPAVPQAQIVDATTLPALQYRPPTVVIVVPGFATVEQAEQFCVQARAANLPPGCTPIPTGG